MRFPPSQERTPKRLFLALLAACLLVVSGPRADAGEADARADMLWDAVRNGHAFAIMRHALAPGTGDPAAFSLGDCATQRNLSDLGRRQAMEIGARFREHGIDHARVYSSAWCRCIDTANLLQLGPVRTLPPLNSFFRAPGKRERQTEALKAWLAEHDTREPLVLVTHQVNIAALTGRTTRSGEVVVARRESDGTVTVLGSL